MPKLPTKPGTRAVTSEPRFHPSEQTSNGMQQTHAPSRTTNGLTDTPEGRELLWSLTQKFPGKSLGQLVNIARRSGATAAKWINASGLPPI
jgi:hypothetical protein